MMHTLDRYFSDNDTDYLTDAIAQALLRDVMDAGLLALAEPDNYNARSEIMWCGSISHNDLTGLGHTKDFSVHQLGHELSAKFDIAHGASLSIMWAKWARFVVSVNPRRFADLGRKVLRITEENDEAAAQLTISGFEDYWQRIGMPVCFSQCKGVGVQSETVLQELARGCSRQDTRKVGVFRPIDTGDMLEIYRAANY
jgi:alcohol dehydrogenase YqhD (iron-dependent ADH family)